MPLEHSGCVVYLLSVLQTDMQYQTSVQQLAAFCMDMVNPAAHPAEDSLSRLVAKAQVSPQAAFYSPRQDFCYQIGDVVRVIFHLSLLQIVHLSE